MDILAFFTDIVAWLYSILLIAGRACFTGIGDFRGGVSIAVQSPFDTYFRSITFPDLWIIDDIFIDILNAIGFTNDTPLILVLLVASFMFMFVSWVAKIIAKFM